MVSLTLPVGLAKPFWSNDRMGFFAAVFIALVFTQSWVMLLTGPGQDPVDPSVSAAARLFFFPAYLLIIWLAVSHAKRTLKAFAGAPLLALMLAVSVASLLWTIDPQVTWRRWAAVFFTTAAGVIVAERFEWPKLLEIFAIAYGATVVLSFVLAVFVPTYGRMIVDFPGAWRGAWSHKNTLGYYMSISFVVFAASAIANPQRRLLWLCAMVAAFALVLFSTSKTSLVSCLLGGGCIPLIAMVRRGRTASVLATLVVGASVIVLAFMLLAEPSALFGLVGKDETFTGRTRIWSAVLHQIAKRPLTGFGFGAVWDDASRWGPLAQISKDQGFVIHEAHSTWLGVWLELGYFGLLAWTLLFVGLWVRTLYAVYVHPAAYFCLPFLVVFSLHSFTESDALAQNDLIWLIFSAVAVKLAHLGRRPSPREIFDAAPSDAG